MVGYSLRQVEIMARIKFRNQNPKSFYFSYDNRMVRIFKAPNGYVLVVDDDYYDDHDVVWGDTPIDVLQAYYDRHRDIFRAEVLEAKVTRIKGEKDDWELEELEEDKEL